MACEAYAESLVKKKDYHRVWRHRCCLSPSDFLFLSKRFVMQRLLFRFPLAQAVSYYLAIGRVREAVNVYKHGKYFRCVLLY